MPAIEHGSLYLRDIAAQGVRATMDEFFTRVDAVKSGPDKAEKQAAIAELKPGDPISLVRDRSISEAPNAVRILTSTGVSLGWLNSMRADQVAPLLDKGIAVIATVENTTGGKVSERTGKARGLGLNIRVRLLDDPSRSGNRTATGSGSLRNFTVDVVGEQFDNHSDGSSRQGALQSVRAGDVAYLICEPDNPKHTRAVMVVTADGEQVGYLPWDLADAVGECMFCDQWLYQASFTKVFEERGFSNARIKARLLDVDRDEAAIDEVLAVFRDMPYSWAQERAREGRVGTTPSRAASSSRKGQARKRASDEGGCAKYVMVIVLVLVAVMVLFSLW